MPTCTHRLVCTLGHTLEFNISVFLSCSSPYCLRQGFSLNLGITNSASSGGCSCLHTLPRVLRSQMWATVPRFSRVAEDSNSGPQARTARTLARAISPVHRLKPFHSELWSIDVECPQMKTPNKRTSPLSSINSLPRIKQHTPKPQTSHSTPIFYLGHIICGIINV